MAKLSFIIPCYFNEKNIPVTTAALRENEKNFPAGTVFEYVCVDDGSGDNTYEALMNFRGSDPSSVKVIKLASNVGSYNAILAGLNYATGDCNVIFTADLQDPPSLIPKMYGYWEKGIKFVIANREKREEGIFRTLFSNLYHNLIRKFALPSIPRGGFDMVLFDRQLRDEVLRISERNTNLIYLLSWLGYDYVNIPYTRLKRGIGKSRWTFRKKLKLFIDSFVSFSYFPLRLISAAGIMLGFIAFFYGIFVIAAKATGLVPVEGWTSIMVVLLFVSSFQMIALGILGEYLWRTLDAARGRPNFIIDKVHQ